MTNERVAVGMSGGVDSSVTAALLLEQGYEVTGVFMECWRAPGCRVDEDRRDAMDVALGLGIPFEVVDFKTAYKRKVVDYFYREYKVGRTPNPDTMCNKEIKFGMFCEEMIGKRDFDYVATGHYARICVGEKVLRRSGGANTARSAQNDKSGLNSFPDLSTTGNEDVVLVRGVDEKKDQSYFLYLLRGEQLRHVLFPLGVMTKDAVRERARGLGLKTADKPDSQGICFIGEVSTKQFLMDLGMKEKRGSVFWRLGSEMLEVGVHDGAWFCTVGQRHGFSIAPSKLMQSRLRELGIDLANLPPLFVLKKDVVKNELVLGTREQLMTGSMVVGDLHMINDQSSIFNFQEAGAIRVRVRHGGELVGVKEISPQGRDDNDFRLVLEKPVFGVAPGQACVFYQGDVVLGGGIIQ